MTPSLPGPGPGSSPFARRFNRHSQRLAVLSGPVRLSVAAASGVGIGSAVCALASVGSGAIPSPGEGTGSAAAQQQQQQGERTVEIGLRSKRGATNSILLFNCLCFMLQILSKNVLTFWGAKINSYILAGQLWRLVTPTFLHSGWVHLLVNSYALHSLGPQLEAISGGPRFLSIYLLSAVTGTLASFVMTPQPSMGASGAIFGIAAALAVFYRRHQESLGKTSDRALQHLGVTAAINVGLSLFIPNIDNWGHLGGLVGGAAFAWLLGPRMQRNQLGRFVDQPPLGLMAHPEGCVFGESARSGGSQQQQEQPAKTRQQQGPEPGPG